MTIYPQADSYCRRTQQQKKIGFRILLLGMLAAICVGPRSFAQQPAHSEGAAAPDWLREKVEVKNTRYEKFKSKTIGQEVAYHIYVPAEYERNPEARYPVLYWLHGMGTGLPAIRLAERFDAAIEAGKTPPMLVVFVNGLRDSFYCDSADGKVPVETVIIKDLIPHVDSSFRTIASRNGRILEGFSLGGFGAAHLGFKYPELFGAVSIIDGSLPPDAAKIESGKPELYERIFGSSAERFAAENPRTLVEKNAAAIRGKMAIRLVVGALEADNRSFHEQLTKLNIAHDYDDFEVGHNPPAIFESLGDKYWQFLRDALSRTGK